MGGHGGGCGRDGRHHRGAVHRNFHGGSHFGVVAFCGWSSGWLVVITVGFHDDCSSIIM